MGWKCKFCGTENPDSGNQCSVCSDVQFGELWLIAEETKSRIRISIDTVVGKRLLKTFAGRESVYASDEQFRILRDKTLAKWAIHHFSGAKNPTFLDGREINDTPAALENGAVISIGPKRMKLTVSIERKG